ncbi:unnamed protein product [Leuciscus chuanchicus]
MSTFNSPNKHIDPQTAPPVDKQLRQTFTSSTFYSNSSRKQQGAWMTSRPRIMTHAKELVAHVLIRTGRLAIGQTLNDDVGELAVEEPGRTKGQSQDITSIPYTHQHSTHSTTHVREDHNTQ